MQLEVVINRKTTKFESNSQQIINNPIFRFCCYQSQNYKIWKQFTTNCNFHFLWVLLLSIAKLQNLKAIHNWVSHAHFDSKVVINRKTTKFESNSQPVLNMNTSQKSCYQSQNYKIWKQFTTLLRILYEASVLLSIAKLQNLKAIHN